MGATIERTLCQVQQSTDAALHRPTTLADYVGQEAAQQPLRTFIQAAKMRQESLDHVLLYGPPGLGKPRWHVLLRRSWVCKFAKHRVQPWKKRYDLAAILTSLEAHDVLFIDEIHRLHPSIEEILYPAMEDRQLDIMLGSGPGAQSVQIDLPPFTLVGATTRAGALTAPLRDRFGIISRLQFYSEASLSQIVTRSARNLGLYDDDDAALFLAQRSAERRVWRIVCCDGCGMWPMRKVFM